MVNSHFGMRNGVVVVVHVPSRNVVCYLMYGKAYGVYWNKGPHTQGRVKHMPNSG
jgi:hypothetical protein